MHFVQQTWIAHRKADEMHRQILAVFMAASALVAGVAEAPVIAEPAQANLTIVAFEDRDEDMRHDPNEAFIPATGTVEFDHTTIQWDGSQSITADVTIPYGSHFVIRGDAFNDGGLYDCSAISGTMVSSGHAYAYLPCDPKNWFEYLHHLYLSRVLGQQP